MIRRVISVLPNLTVGRVGAEDEAALAAAGVNAARPAAERRKLRRESDCIYLRPYYMLCGNVWVCLGSACGGASSWEWERPQPSAEPPFPAAKRSAPVAGGASSHPTKPTPPPPSVNR